MARHRQRTRATHELTARRREQTDTDELGSPIYNESTVLEDILVRFDAGGTAFVREDSGERIQRSPTISGPATQLGDLRAGDRVELDPLVDDGWAVDGLEVRSVTPTYGRRARASTLTVELERID